VEHLEKQRRAAGMKTVKLPSGEKVPALGLGTWRMGDDSSLRREELATLRLALDLGVSLMDTAEMYGDGRAEELVGEAIAGRREEVFLVSKVLPQHATRPGTRAACEGSLRRLHTDRIDLYLLHWRGDVPLSETLAGFVELQKEGKIRNYGVSNFDVADMKELLKLPGGAKATTDQVLYNLSRRGIEWELLPWLREQGIPVMAYSPVEEGRLLRDASLTDFSRRHGLTPAQTALGWLLASEDVIAIPKTSRREKLRENLAALDHPLSIAQLRELDALFAPPQGPTPLEMI
jgi:aldehyde reductase